MRVVAVIVTTRTSTVSSLACPPTAAPVDAVAETLRKWRALNHVPGVAVSVRRAGQAVYDVASGAASLRPDGSRERSLTSSDTFDIASVSKTITAAAVLRMAERGELDLDAPLSTWHPEFPEAQRITVRQLLDQTSGVPDFDGDEPDNAFMRALTDHPDLPWAPGRPIAEAAKLPRTAAPGDHFAYSNTNYQLLSDIVERVSGKPLDAILRSEVAAPAGVADGDMIVPAATGRFPATADPLHYTDTAWRSIRDSHYGENSLLRTTLRGDGAVLASASTLAKVGEGILWRGGSVLDAPTRAAMLGAADASPAGYGYGIVVSEIATPGGIDTKAHWHNGGVNGYRTLLAHLPEQELTIAVTANGTWLSEDALTSLQTQLIDLAQGGAADTSAI